MPRSTCIISVMLFIGMMMRLSAQEIPAQPAALTEAAAVQLALQNHPMVREAQAEAGMARAQVGMARSERRLQVSANGLGAVSTMANSLATPNVMPQAILQSQDRSSLDLNGMAMLPLYTGGRIRQTIRAAELSSQASESQVAATRVLIASDARMAFAEWQQALAMVRVAEDTVTAQQRTTTQVQLLYDTGKVPRFDLLRTQAALAAAQQQLANAQADVIAARARLAQALGVSAETLTAPAEETTLPTPPTDTLQAALSKRPELQAAQYVIAAREATVRARQANYKPQVYAFGMVDAIAPAQMGDNAGVSVGVVAGLPILDGGRRRAEVEEAQQSVAQARAARENIELQVRADVASAEARVTAARQNIETANTQVTAAEEAYSVAQTRYAAGRGTIVELLDAQRALTEARQNVIIARAQYRAALANLYRAIGVDAVPVQPTPAI